MRCSQLAKPSPLAHLTSRFRDVWPVQLVSPVGQLTLTVFTLIVWCSVNKTLAWEGVRTLRFADFENCIELTNPKIRVVLCPSAGGRVLEYARDGQNVLYQPTEQSQKSGREAMNAGRFDIGPEQMRHRGKVLWSGVWTGELTGDRAARLTSEFDPESGVRLTRDFRLDEKTSQLRCTQTIINESDEPVELCHWSRTFAVGGGIAIVPRKGPRRFPNGYVLYENGGNLNFRPTDDNVIVSEDTIMIPGPPKFPKLGFDSHAGWLAYLTPADQLFVKRYRTYPDRAYNEVAALTASVWYPEKDRVEIEPIGPAENLPPGNQASFTEDWWLLPHPFPDDVKSISMKRLEDKVKKETKAVKFDIGQPDSPQIDDDRRVTFRMVASTAATVEVDLHGKKRRLSQQADGVWAYQTEPLDPGIHDYHFLVDGVSVTDPRNRTIKKWNVCGSMFEIPGDPPLLTERQSVPHGVVHRHLYSSKGDGIVGLSGNIHSTNAERAAIVYTPPGYDPNRAEPYPLVVLCHGFGDDETAWTEVGRAHLIADNMIASGQIEPMVIVMPNGHPVPLAQRTWSDEYGSRNSEAMVKDVVNDLLPLVDQHYHVTSEGDRRAVVGLSMGGGHSIAAGMQHPEVFGWVGAFSAATPKGELAKEHVALLSKSDAGHELRKLFWIACGKDDFLFKRNVEFHKQLETNNVQHQFVRTEGAHNWIVWREYLPIFLRQLF